MKSFPVNVPDGEKGAWRVESFEVSEEESGFTRIRAIQHPEEYVPAGKYKRLMRGGCVVMSNTPMELRTHQPIIWHAKGSVLLNGLGLGACLTAILAKPGGFLKKVTVIEIDQNVIDLVAPSFQQDKRVTIIQGDAFVWQPPNGDRFDAVWHDIWTDMCSDNLPAMTKLKRKYARRCDWQGCWAEDIIRSHRRRGW